MTGTYRSPLEALADELGAVAARIEREVRLQVAAALAEIREEMAALRASRSEVELRAVNAERALADAVAARLADVRNGQDGEPGPPVDRTVVEALVADAVAAAVEALPPAENGKDADPVLIAELVAAEVAKLPPAKPGKSVDPEEVEALVTEQLGAQVVRMREDMETELLAINQSAERRLNAAFEALPVPKDGEDGRSVDPEEVRALVSAEVEQAIKSLPVPADGHTPTLAELSPLIEEAVSTAIPAFPKPKDGEDGRSVDPEDIRRMVAEEVGRLPPAEKGEKGDRGESVKGDAGPPGKLSLAREWRDGVWYEGDVVTHDGRTYQAQRDTGREPPHEDWLCLAEAGRDGEPGNSFRVRGTWDAGNDYLALDVVALNGSSFIAKLDDPGPCPGGGWQLIAAVGKAGRPGEKGPPGQKGDIGRPGAPVLSLNVDEQGMLTLTNGDGSIVNCDLYPVLARCISPATS